MADDIQNSTLYRFVRVVYNSYSEFGYSYLDTNRIASEGDYVWVPVGVDNEKRIAHVISVGDYTKENAPYPIEKTKSVIRLASDEEVEYYDGYWE